MFAEKVKGLLKRKLARVWNRCYGRRDLMLSAKFRFAYAFSLRFKAFYRYLNRTWLGDLWSIYRSKELWITVSLALWLFILPAFWLWLLFTVAPPFNALLFYLSFIGLTIGSIWGNPQQKR